MITYERAMQEKAQLDAIEPNIKLLSEEDLEIYNKKRQVVNDALSVYDSALRSDVPTDFVLSAKSQAAKYRKDEQLRQQAAMTTGEKIAQVGRNILGTGEALLTLGSGATTGAIGQLAGVAYGILQGIRSDEAFTSREVQEDIEKMADSIASKTVYTPRTPEGQEIMQALAGYLEPLAALMPTMNYATVPFLQTLRMTGKQVGSMLVQRKANDDQGKLEPIKVIQLAEDAATGKSNVGAWAALAAERDPAVVEAASRLGILDFMQADHLTTNQQFRELAQALKSIPASKYNSLELEALESINLRLKEVIDDLGTKKLSQIDYDVREKLKSYRDSLQERANKINDEVIKVAIPNSDRVDVPNLRAKIAQLTEEFGGYQEIPLAYRQLFEKLTGKDGNKRPTYAAFDYERKQANSSYDNRGAYKDFSKQEVDEILSILREDGRAIAKSYNVGDAYDVMQSLYKSKFSVQDDLIALFGKELDKSLINPLSGGIGKLKQGDVMSLTKFLESVPEDLRNNVLVSGLAAAFKKEGQAVNFKKYEQLYEAIVSDKRVRTMIFKGLTKEQRRVFVDLYQVSKSINKATKERISTGRLSVAKEVLDTKVNNVFNGILSKVGRAVSMTGEPAASYVFSRLGKGQDAVVGDVIENVLDSREFNNLIRFMDTERENAALDAFLRKKGSFMKSTLGIGSPEQFMKQLIAANASIVQQQEEEKEKK